MNLLFTLLTSCNLPSGVPEIPSVFVRGTVTNVQNDHLTNGMVYSTITLSPESDEEPVDLVVLGSNGLEPYVDAEFPILSLGTRWEARLVQGQLGWTPKSGEAGLLPLDAGLRYNLNGLHYDSADLPFEFGLNPAGMEHLNVEDVETVVQDVLAQWTEVPCSDWVFSYIGLVDTDHVEDGLNVLSWETEEWILDPSIAGVTVTRFDTSTGVPRPVEADIQFNAVSWDWHLGEGDSVTKDVDLGSVLLHEAGHVTGMDHEYEKITSTMFYGYIGGTWMNTLDGDDMRGLCENYENGVQGCETDGDCTRHGAEWSCEDLDGLKVCTEAKDSLGAFCNRVDINCESHCLFTDNFAMEGYCTLPCNSDDECGEGYACDSVDTGFLPPGEPQQLCVEANTAEDTETGNDTGNDDGDTGEPPKGGCQLAPTPSAFFFVLLPLLFFRKTIGVS